MKRQTINFRICDTSIGYQARKVTLGPESDLVTAFLESGLEGKGYSFTSARMAIFIEPKIDSGFPDIVLAEYKPGFFNKWKAARNELTSADLKLLSFLYSVDGANIRDIRDSMCISALSAEKSIELLADADLVDRDRVSRCWKPRPLDKTFGISRLIAVEAKVCNNEEVLEQASKNRWFASESWALTPVSPKRDFLSRVRSAGIGMVAATGKASFRKCAQARTFVLPSSYVSWQFNEWIGRKLSKGKCHVNGNG